MTRWLDDLHELRQAGEDCFLVTVMDVRGSAPREVGAKMLVTKDEITGTIGGGQLEYQCTKLAAEHLAAGRFPPAESSRDCSPVPPSPTLAEPFVRRFTLGANCGQCCGGVVDVLFEPIQADARNLPGTPAVSTPPVGARPAGDPPPAPRLPAESGRSRAGSPAGRPPTRGWLTDLVVSYEQREPVVVATVQVPDGGIAKYLVTGTDCRGYGAPGDTLSSEVIDEAQQIISVSGGAKRIRPKEKGGLAILLEPVMSSDFRIALFGAGHTGSAVVRSLAGMDCSLRWIDSRRGVFPERLPDDVTCIETAHPEREVAAMPPGAYYLVMTYSHALDYEIVSRVLARGDFAYCGLIGSLSKRRRFERRLRKEGMADSLIERLVCPIGIAGIDSKQPEAIAIAVAAELLQIRSARASQSRNDKQKATNLRILRR